MASSPKKKDCPLPTSSYEVAAALPISGSDIKSTLSPVIMLIGISKSIDVSFNLKNLNPKY
jgi:hypothetical protein